jgi:hypothetical protein
VAFRKIVCRHNKRSRAQLTIRARLRQCRGLSLSVREAFERFDPPWEELFPAEQARIVRLLVESVHVKPDGLELRFRTLGTLSRKIGDGLRRAA